MKQFAALFSQLNQTHKTNERVRVLKDYLAEAPDNDKPWTLALSMHKRPVNTTQRRSWAAEVAYPDSDWLFVDSYAEGLMLKRLNTPCQVGRHRGDWWKWKVDPLTSHGVLILRPKRQRRHKSGVALRFPRMARWRHDKKAEDANTLEELPKMLKVYG